MKGKVVLMAVMAACVCWMCSCDINTQQVNDISVTVIPRGSNSTFLAISGKGFSRKAAENQVIVGAKAANVVSATPQRLIVKVPGEVQDRLPVTVKVKEQTSNVTYLQYAVAASLAEALRP
jgi:hypothetical protein